MLKRVERSHVNISGSENSRDDVSIFSKAVATSSLHDTLQGHTKCHRKMPTEVRPKYYNSLFYQNIQKMLKSSNEFCDLVSSKENKRRAASKDTKKRYETFRGISGQDSACNGVEHGLKSGKEFLGMKESRRSALMRTRKTSKPNHSTCKLKISSKFSMPKTFLSLKNDNAIQNLMQHSKSIQKKLQDLNYKLRTVGNGRINYNKMFVKSIYKERAPPKKTRSILSTSLKKPLKTLKVTFDILP
ncbi:unnamed protein product [Moneuplotes crassus]|uniref:Uncharacterized protein n=1 Tax=Euplotes crassus TaxID=5936 RepID=A0AAD1Y6K5_EUPCR|nr:unnamed protein product [Moneuplotes crassus]